MRRVSLLFAMLLLPGLARAQTVTPNLTWNTPDTVARVTAFTTTLQIGAGTVAQVAPTCVAAGTGSTCTLTAFVFDATKPTTFKVTIIDPASGLTANGTLNYVPGVPPASFTLSLQWKVTIP